MNEASTMDEKRAQQLVALERESVSTRESSAVRAAELEAALNLLKLQCSALEQRLKDSRESHAHLDRENHELKSKLQKMDDAQQLFISQNTLQLSEKSMMIDDLQRRLSHLSSELESVTRKLTSSTEVNTMLEHQVKAKNSELEATFKALQSAGEEKSKIEVQLREVTLKLQEVTASLQTTQMQRSALDEELLLCRKLVKDDKDEPTENMEKLGEMNSLNSLLQHKVAELELALDDARTQVKTSAIEILSLQQNSIQSSCQKDQQIRDKMGEISELAIKLRSRDTELSSLRDQLRRSEEKVLAVRQNCDAEVKDIKVKIELLLSENSSLQDELIRISLVQNELQQKLDSTLAGILLRFQLRFILTLLIREFSIEASPRTNLSISRISPNRRPEKTK